MHIFTAGEDISAQKINENFAEGNNKKSVIAGEAIDVSSCPLVVFVKQDESTAESTIVSQTTDNNDDFGYGGDIMGNTFTVLSTINRLTEFTFKIAKVSSYSGAVELRVYATSGGLKTGDPIATKLLNMASVSSWPTYANHTITLDSELSVTPSGVYYVGLYCPGGDGSSKLGMRLATSNVYSGGQWVKNTTASSSQDAVFSVSGYYGDENKDKAFLSDANDLVRNKFTGFAVSSATGAGESFDLSPFGIVPGFTGLLKGAYYYLQDTAGTIGTTKGSTPILVGQAISDTEIVVINNQNGNVYSIKRMVAMEGTDTDFRTNAATGTLTSPAELNNNSTSSGGYSTASGQYAEVDFRKIVSLRRYRQYGHSSNGGGTNTFKLQFYNLETHAFQDWATGILARTTEAWSEYTTLEEVVTNKIRLVSENSGNTYFREWEVIY